jgi:outer membrane protein assembly factor BamB
MLLTLKTQKITSLLILLALTGCTNIDYVADFPAKKPVAIKNKVAIKKSWEQYMGRNRLEQDNNVSLQPWDKGLVGVDFAGNLKVLDLAQGNFAKNIPIDAKIAVGPVIRENIAVLATKDNRLLAINLNYNSTIWSINLDSEVYATPLIIGKSVVIHALSGAVISYNLDNGKQNWRYNHALPSLIMRKSSAPIAYNDYVIVGLADGKLVALHKTSGMVAWTFDLASNANLFAETNTREILDVCVDPLIFDNKVFAARFDGKLVALNADTGDLLWEREIASYAGFAVHQNKLLVIGTTGNLYALDYRKGTTIWQQTNLVGRRLSQPVVYNKYLATSDTEGLLYLVSLDNGELAGHYRLLRDGVLSKLTVIKQKLYVLGTDGQLIALEIPGQKVV